MNTVQIAQRFLEKNNKTSSPATHKFLGQFDDDHEMKNVKLREIQRKIFG